MKYQNKNNKIEDKMIPQPDKSKGFILFPDDLSSSKLSKINKTNEPKIQLNEHTKDLENTHEGIPEESSEIQIPKEKENSNIVIIGNYSEAPDFLQDNEFIKRGYRINCNTIPKVLKSLFMLHNETINIWTHLLGLILAIGFIIYTAIFVIKSKAPSPLINYEKMVNELKDVAIKWNDTIQVISQETDDREVLETLNNIKSSTRNFFEEIAEKINFKDKFNNYIESMEDIIEQAKTKIADIKKGKIFKEIKETWDTIQDKMFQIVDVYGIGANIQKRLNDSEKSDEDSLEIWPLFIMLIGGIFCLGCSTIYHLFMPLSPKVNAILSRFDYGAITILIAGSCFPPYYYFYYCEKCKYNKK